MSNCYSIERCLQLIVLFIVIDLQGLARPHATVIPDHSNFSKYFFDHVNVTRSENVSNTLTAVDDVNTDAGASNSRTHMKFGHNKRSVDTNDIENDAANMTYLDDEGENFIADDEDYEYGNDDITLPDHLPECAISGHTFCENVAEYPTQHINDLMNITSVKGMLQNDTEPPPLRLSQRVGATLEYDNFCTTATRIIYPKLALTIDNHWLTIVNQAQFLQGVNVELCMHQDRCGFADILPNGYVSQCRQRFDNRLLLSVDHRGNPRKNYFRLPSHCECMVKKVRRN